MQLQLLLNETSMKHAAPIGLCSMRVVAVSLCVYICECACVRVLHNCYTTAVDEKCAKGFQNLFIFDGSAL